MCSKSSRYEIFVISLPNCQLTIFGEHIMKSNNNEDLTICNTLNFRKNGLSHLFTSYSEKRLILVLLQYLQNTIAILLVYDDPFILQSAKRWKKKFIS